MSSIYELDPKWKKLLTLENFLGGLTVHEFIEELGKDQTLHGTKARSSSGTWEQLDPNPYIRTFESILKELKILNKESSSRSGFLESQVSQSELQHAQNVTKLNYEFKQLLRNYDHLDDKLTSVSQVVSPLGDKLEKSIKRKNSFIKSVELISHYNSFYLNQESLELEKLIVSNKWNDKVQGSVLLKYLLILARKIDTKSIPRTLETTSLITNYSEKMENQLLHNFNLAYRSKDFNKLNEIAVILNYFNGGVNMIQSFINHHDYFVDSNQIDIHNDDIFANDDIKFKLTNPDNHHLFNESTISNELISIEDVIKKEADIVKKVFEDKASHVIQLFIQSVFSQKIEPKVTLLLNASLSLSNLAYIRMLHALYILVGNFVKKLSEYFNTLEFDNGFLCSALDQCYNDIFLKIIFDRSKYFDIERKSLETILIQKTTPFNSIYDKDIKLRNLAGKFSDRASISNDTEFQALTSTSSGKMFQFNNFFKNHLDKERRAISRANSYVQATNRNMSVTRTDSLNEKDSEFTLTHIDTMLKCFVESLARLMELIPSKASDFTYELLETVLMGIINTYVESGLEVAFAQMLRVDIYKEDHIDLSYFKYISKSTQILSVLSASIKTIVLPLVNNSSNIKKKIIELTNAYLKRCEVMINIIIEETVELFSQQFTFSLSKQKKKDFIPVTQDVLDQDTIPASENVASLNILYSQITLHLKNDNLKSFLNEIGEILYQQLLNHYKKFQVSSIGGIIVTKDIIAMQTVIEEWNIPDLTEKFATLRELANLFTVQPELLDSLTKEGRLTNVSHDIISDYISRRDDFNHEGFMTKFRMNLRS